MGFLLGFGAGTLETTMGAYVIAQDKNAKGMNILEVFRIRRAAVSFSYLYPYGTICLAFPLYALFIFVFVLACMWVVYLRRKTPALLPVRWLIRKNRLYQPYLKPEGKKNIFLFLIFAFVYAGIETNFANFCRR